jgi:hypothetical protein
VTEDVQAAIARGIDHFARKVAKRRLPVPIEDVTQAGWLAVLRADLASFNPRERGANNWVLRVVSRSVGPQMNEWLAVTTLSKAAKRNGQAQSRQIRKSIRIGDSHRDHEDSDSGDDRSEPVDEGALGRVQDTVLQRDLRRARIRLMRAFITVSKVLTPVGVEVAEAVLGLDGRGMRLPRAVEEEMHLRSGWGRDLWRHAQYHLTRSSEFLRAWREVQILEQDLEGA